jgi:dTDP-4-amino-4,6-dideoxygalactose transaminase
VDIDPVTFNLDPKSVAAAVTDATKAIVPVHLFGHPAPMDALQQIARRHQLAVVEDAAQSIGAKWHDQPVGAIGEVGCISFYPTKNLGGFGDGGMLVTSHDALAERLRLLRVHGMQPRYYHSQVGVNSRLDGLQAAVLNVKLPQLERWTQRRRENAQRYHQLLREAGLDEHLTRPVQLDHVTHVWNQYTVRVHNGQRDALREHLREAGIGTEVYYPIPLHQQECFRHLGYQPGSLPQTERAAQEVLSLPVFPYMTEAEQEAVVYQISRFFCRGRIAPTADLPSRVTTNTVSHG